MRRLLFILVAFSLLNQSIDFDHLAVAGSEDNPNYDDVDSIFELVVENITGDDHFTSENDGDSSDPMNKSVDKSAYSFVYYSEPVRKITLQQGDRHDTIDFYHLNATGKTCKGFFSIVVPPPDVVAL